MKVKDLKATNTGYDPAQMERIAAYYDGGFAFPVSKELRGKPSEKAGSEVGYVVREMRESTAVYTNYFGDIILDLASDMCSIPLCIESDDEYYNRLNTNSDGKNSGANEQTRSAVLDDLLHNRSFYIVSYPKSEATTLSEQRKQHSLNARISALPCALVTDWEDGENGTLAWAKVSEKFCKRSSAFGPADVKMNRWTIFTANDCQIYTAPENAKDEDDISPEIIPHGNGACPIFKTNRTLNCHVAAKYLPTAYLLFNEESDASFYRFATITGAPMLFTRNPGDYEKGVSMTPMGLLLLGGEDRFERDKCDPATLQALEAATASRRAQLGGMIHNLARQTASQAASGQNTSRASGTAIASQRDPLESFLKSFAEPQIAVWNSMLCTIAKLRGDDESVFTVDGLIGSGEELQPEIVTTDRMTAEAGFAALVYVPKEAKKNRGIELGLAANPDADEKTRIEIRKGVPDAEIQAVIAQETHFSSLHNPDGTLKSLPPKQDADSNG